MNTKAFTMLEIILVIVTIGLLAMGILSYIRDDEHTTRYKAEACLNKIQAKVTNYVNAALTSKKIGENTEQYIIRFDREEPSSMFFEKNPQDEGMSEKIDFSEVC
ncbi:MAG: type II secretion system GspH family protein [Candidatus Peribacteria bacterium]|nr:type II secretion system GspH family protein [Candidatus Peribacteria bacterium]